MLPSLDGVDPAPVGADGLDAAGVTVLNPRAALLAAQDKLATAQALAAAGFRTRDRSCRRVAPFASIADASTSLLS